MPELKVFALKKLDMIVDEFWPEISEAIEKMYVQEKKNTKCIFMYYCWFHLALLLFICLFYSLSGYSIYSEILHEDKSFQQHELAALVASKVYYHLGSFEDSLTYALGAGELFDVNARNEYVDTTIGMSNYYQWYLIKLLISSY